MFATLEGIQIHHINGDHWVTSASIGGKVAVYDSRFKGDDLSLTLTHQLASLYRPLIILEEDRVEVDPHLVVCPTSSATEWDE
jgi:SNF2 family DNA or RNA helicase